MNLDNSVKQRDSSWRGFCFARGDLTGTRWLWIIVLFLVLQLPWWYFSDNRWQRLQQQLPWQPRSPGLFWETSLDAQRIVCSRLFNYSVGTQLSILNCIMFKIARKVSAICSGFLTGPQKNYPHYTHCEINWGWNQQTARSHKNLLEEITKFWKKESKMFPWPFHVKITSFVLPSSNCGRKISILISFRIYL